MPASAVLAALLLPSAAMLTPSLEQAEQPDTLSVAEVAVAAAIPHSIADTPAPGTFGPMDLSTYRLQPAGNTATVPQAHTAYRLSGFSRDVSAAGWEVGLASAYVLLPRIVRRADSSVGFSIRSEGLFGRDTKSLGMDKLLHGFKAYVLTDVLQAAIAHRTGDDRSAIITAGILGAGLSTIAEVLDGFSPTGFNPEDAAVNIAGAGFSMLRNSVPALHDVLDFRLSLDPAFDGSLSTTEGRLDRSRYLLAFQPGGMPVFERTPLRFVELHLGYYASGFTAADRAAGEPLRRHVYVGIGFNVQALFSRRPARRVERIARDLFDYVQIPWVATDL